MDQIPLVTSSTLMPVDKFWNSVLVYHDRPHFINRKLVTVSPVLLCEIWLDCSKIKRISEIFTREALLYEIRKLDSFSSVTVDFIRKITETHDPNARIETTTWDRFWTSPRGTFISIRVLFPRASTNKCLEIVIFDKEKKLVSFFAVQEFEAIIAAPRFPYHLELTQNGNLRILLNTFDDADTSSAEWLADKLFPKLLKWADFDNEKVTWSLTLVAPDEYCTVYSSLKSKYSDNIVKHWNQKTRTDPQKYVFEDIAIASYLICLWRQFGSDDVNFVDLGCGNGLLVYLLNLEGYKGCGFDIRKRKVWDIYGNAADLRIGTITPESCFSEATWLIGNHSDELTPWIPIIATKSSPRTNFFVLPCCSYELNGQKYARLDTSRSQYEEYLDYIKNISIMCGFLTSVDKLRIPSTRRTCLVGIRDKCQDSEMSDIKLEISAFVEKRVGSSFTPREVVEKVRNCTTLNKDLVERILNLVVKELLASGVKEEGRWNQGGTKELSELIKTISAEDRQSLKNECGGLQTLLKNHRYIFRVCQGRVSLRTPLSLKECDKYKDKPCWFERNHPDGCYFQSDLCAYKHENK